MLEKEERMPSLSSLLATLLYLQACNRCTNTAPKTEKSWTSGSEGKENRKRRKNHLLSSIICCTSRKKNLGAWNCQSPLQAGHPGHPLPAVLAVPRPPLVALAAPLPGHIHRTKTAHYPNIFKLSNVKWLLGFKQCESAAKFQTRVLPRIWRLPNQTFLVQKYRCRVVIQNLGESWI